VNLWTTESYVNVLLIQFVGLALPYSLD
jgi:hypothetical protein